MKYLPDYKGNSIVNLTSSIMKALGAKPKYPLLKKLAPDKLKAKNLVLIVVDGLGYKYVIKHSKSGLKKYLRTSITSVFPSATTSAISSFHFGTAPQQHALTGWFTHLKELGMVTIPLPFVSRKGHFPLLETGIEAEDIFEHPGIYEKIKVPSYIVFDKKIVNSVYTKTNTKKAKRISYTGLNDFFRKLKKTARINKKKFVFAYLPKFDSLAHEYGINSKKTLKYFTQLEKKLTAFLKSAGKDTKVIITADHGLIDTKKSRIIDIKKHPKLAETLSLPLCGEGRQAYCYVYASKAKQFEKYVKKNLGNACHIYKSRDLVKKGFFGLFKPNPKLFDRIGDYTLITKENYAFGNKNEFNIGNHGSLSKEEMLVPLIVKY